jgi:hypothetical protein
MTAFGKAADIAGTHLHRPESLRRPLTGHDLRSGASAISAVSAGRRSPRAMLARQPERTRGPASRRVAELGRADLPRSGGARTLSIAAQPRSLGRPTNAADVIDVSRSLRRSSRPSRGTSSSYLSSPAFVGSRRATDRGGFARAAQGRHQHRRICARVRAPASHRSFVERGRSNVAQTESHADAGTHEIAQVRLALLDAPPAGAAAVDDYAGHLSAALRERLGVSANGCRMPAAHGRCMRVPGADWLRCRPRAPVVIIRRRLPHVRRSFRGVAHRAAATPAARAGGGPPTARLGIAVQALRQSSTRIELGPLTAGNTEVFRPSSVTRSSSRGSSIASSAPRATRHAMDLAEHLTQPDDRLRWGVVLVRRSRRTPCRRAASRRSRPLRRPRARPRTRPEPCEGPSPRSAPRLAEIEGHRLFDGLEASCASTPARSRYRFT